MLKVLIADDSPTARQILRYIIQSGEGMEVVGEALNGKQAVQMTQDLEPNVVLMDLIMPEMDGLEATSEIMHRRPTPIVVVSSTVDGRETEVAFQAIKAGALTVLPKPAQAGSADFSQQMNTLQNTIRAMSGVSVIHHWKRQRAPEPLKVNRAAMAQPPRILAITASTGGPAALSEVIGKLPADFPLPVVIVQHIAPDFLPSLVKWLNSVTALHVVVAEPGTKPQPGWVYIAPGDAHLYIDMQQRFRLESHTTARHMPSGDVLFQSVAQVYGPQAIGVVLTGMGDDGARGLRAMRDAGAFTIAQDEATAAVFGMPREAAALGGAGQVVALDEIAPTVMQVSLNKEKLT
jgi:two-component system, chemotaxis family, protein-glutamate methylesterase/glutaminase